MQIEEQPLEGQPVTTTGESCPFVRFEDVHAETTPALWPMDNLNYLRDQARVYFGDAAGHEFWMCCPLRAGQMAFLPLVAANRDPTEFPNADQVIIDRGDNRHIAFGAGPRRCLGSHLARQELRIGLTDWHARIPNYRLADGAEIREHGGQIGLDNLPLIW